MSTKPGKSRWSAIAGAIFIAGLLIVPPILGYMEWRRYTDGQTWPEVSCTMHEMLQKRGRRTAYVYTLQYSYRIDAKLYESSNYGLLASPNEGVMDFGNAHPNGSIVPCFVNPADPTDVVVRRDFGHIPGIYWILPAFFGFLWLVGAVVAVIWLVNLFERRRADRSEISRP